MQKSNEKGFSLVELLVVVVIVGIIAAISIPLYKKAILGTENAAVFALIKIMVQEQTNYFSQNSRYARLDELNQKYNNNFGTSVGNTISRGKFTLSMSPATPTNTDLKENFTIVATRTIDSVELPYVISVDATGDIVQIVP